MRPSGVRQLILVALLFIAAWGIWSACSAADFEPRKPIANSPIGPASLPETQQGYERFYDGDCEGAAACFGDAIRKNQSEASALYALATQADGFNDCQKSLGLLSRAVVAAENSPWAELYLEEIGIVLPYCRDPKPFLDAVAKPSRIVQVPAEHQRPRARSAGRAPGTAREVRCRGRRVPSSAACRALAPGRTVR